MSKTTPASPTVTTTHPEIWSRYLHSSTLSHQHDDTTDLSSISSINPMTQTTRFVNEAIATSARRNRQNDDDKKTWISDEALAKLYPEYSQNALHYQMDGWMSLCLFLGRQDAMQWVTLPPIATSVKNRKVNRHGERLSSKGAEGSRDQLDLDMEYTAVLLETARNKWWLLEKEMPRDRGTIWQYTC